MNVQKKARKSVPIAHGKATAQKTSETNAFAVSASSSLSELKSLVLKHDNTFGVFDAKGDALSSPGGTEGVYHCDTRHLSHFLITVSNRRPIVLSSTLRDDNTTLPLDLRRDRLPPGRFPGEACARLFHFVPRCEAGVAIKIVSSCFDRQFQRHI